MNQERITPQSPHGMKRDVKKAAVVVCTRMYTLRAPIGAPWVQSVEEVHDMWSNQASEQWVRASDVSADSHVSTSDETTSPAMMHGSQHRLHVKRQQY